MGARSVMYIVLCNPPKLQELGVITSMSQMTKLRLNVPWSESPGWLLTEFSMPGLAFPHHVTGCSLLARIIIIIFFFLDVIITSVEVIYC